MNARNTRMIREITISDRALAGAIMGVLVVAVIVAASPPRFAPAQLAASPIDARAAAPVGSGRMPAPDSTATEGNVVDQTY